MTNTIAENKQKAERAQYTNIGVPQEVKDAFLVAYRDYALSFTRAQRVTLKVNHGTFLFDLLKKWREPVAHVGGPVELGEIHIDTPAGVEKPEPKEMGVKVQWTSSDDPQ